MLRFPIQRATIETLENGTRQRDTQIVSLLGTMKIQEVDLESLETLVVAQPDVPV